MSNNLLATIASPADMRRLSRSELRALCDGYLDAYFRYYVDEHEKRPDAIFSTNGPTGLGVLRAMRDLGLETPRDLGFVTFDELTVDDLFLPAITTIVQPAYEIGFRAAEILLNRIEGIVPEDASITVKLAATLKVRGTSRARS